MCIMKIAHVYEMIDMGVIVCWEKIARKKSSIGSMAIWQYYICFT